MKDYWAEEVEPQLNQGRDYWAEEVTPFLEEEEEEEDWFIKFLKGLRSVRDVGRKTLKPEEEVSQLGAVKNILTAIPRFGAGILSQPHALVKMMEEEPLPPEEAVGQFVGGIPLVGAGYRAAKGEGKEVLREYYQEPERLAMEALMPLFMKHIFTQKLPPTKPALARPGIPKMEEAYEQLAKPKVLPEALEKALGIEKEIPKKEVPGKAEMEFAKRLREEGVPEKPAVARAKEPWEMTKKQAKQQLEEQSIVAKKVGRPIYNTEAFNEYHQRQVTKALSEGKPVPKEVLAEYPELKGKAEPTIPAEKLEPIGEVGKIKVRGLSKHIEEKAIEGSLIEGFGDLPEYSILNMKNQATKAAEFILKDYEKARRVAMGQESAPEGITPEAVLVGIENAAIKSGDVVTIRDLAVNSKLMTEATAMGQRIRTLGERNPTSAIGAIREIVRVKEKAVRRRIKNIGAAKNRIVDDIKTQIKKARPTRETWGSFIESIKC